MRRPGVAGERREDLSVGHVPDPGRLVRRSGDELGAVAADVQAEDGVRVTGEITDGLALIDVPELGGLVGRGREQQIAVLE